MEQSAPSDKFSSGIKEILSLYGTRRFITVFTSARKVSLKPARPHHFLYHQPDHTMLPYFFMIFYSLLGLPTEFFPSVPATKTNTPFPPLQYVPHAHPMSPFLVCSPEHHLVRSTFIERLIMKCSPFFCFFSALQPPVGHGLLIHEVSRSHTTTHHSR